MRRLSTILVVALFLTAGRAEAVTTKDIIDLARAGLGEAVLLALIEVDGGVFTIDKTTLTSLKAAGVSERVIEAMIRSGRNRPIETPPTPVPVVDREPPQPQVIVIEHERPVVHEVVVPVPVFVPVGVRIRARSHELQPPLDVFRGFNPSLPGFVPIQPLVPQPPKRPEPVYWGWGGKLRPDAWKPAPEGKR